MSNKNVVFVILVMFSKRLNNRCFDEEEKGMRKEYESPVLYAEKYVFSESIAKCAHSVDPNEPVTINYRDNVCGGGYDGHCFGGQNGEKGNIHTMDKISDGGYVTLFNDGNVENGCQYDWDYENDVVYLGEESRGSFAEAFYGNDANGNQHAPGHKAAAFFS